MGSIRTMKTILLGCALYALAGPLTTPAVAAEVVEPFETRAPSSKTPLDDLVLPSLRAKGLEPANACSDAVFLRRAYLDLIGTLPELEEAKEFLEDTRHHKRAALVDSLMEREEFAYYWTMKWCDLLRVKAEFPINLWPNAVQAYHRWILHAIRINMPYDQFARELLTASGSNFRVPQVNFYRAIQGKEPSTIAHAVALTFMGTRLNKWPKQDRYAMETFFSRVAFKGTAEWKEEIVVRELDLDQTETMKTVFPDGSKAVITADQDPRKVFADWLITPNNPWFARNIVNRQWSWLMGRGIIHEPDDIREDNPPVHPALLSYLERELVKSNYDLRHIFRLIMNSRTYQQSSIPQSKSPEAERLFACYPVRRLDAEVLIDALCQLTGTTEDYSSMIPEPFTFIPESQRTIALADGSITGKFLEMFGRPPRDTGLESERNREPSAKQRLHMLNSTHIQRKIMRSAKIRQLITKGGKKPDAMIRSIYLAVLSRRPTKAEVDRVRDYAASSSAQIASQDLVWALINSKEFLYRH